MAKVPLRRPEETPKHPLLPRKVKFGKDVFVSPKRVACNNGAGGFRECLSKPKRPLLPRKVRLKI